MALLCLNRFQLPIEMIDIIKEFAFYDVQRARLRRAYSSIFNQINESIKKQTKNEYYFFRIFTKRHFYCVFCTKCGDYVHSDETNAMCKCIFMYE